ncbi:MAG: Ig-like domain-containing protein [Armatimonadota bacterium]|nr:Ig-like domain-containing protein [bacterium]
MQRKLFAAILCLLLAPSMKVCAVGLAPGTEIVLQATGQYTNDTDEDQATTSAILTLTVVQYADVAIDWNVAEDTIAQGDYAYFPMTITNTGNSSDNFALTATSANGWDADIIYDDDFDDTVITETGTLVADGYVRCFLRIFVPADAEEPDIVTITATSAYDATVSSSAIIDVPEPGLKSTKLTASASPESPYAGQDVTVSGSLSPAMSQPIEFTLTTPGAQVITSTTTTNADGSFEMNFNADEVGDYQLAISFDGDETYNDCNTTITITSQQKIETSITLECLPETPYIGDTVTVTGTISPVLEGSISLECTQPGGSSTTTSLTSASDGTFTYTTTLNAEGQWYFNATYAGNESHAACAQVLSFVATVRPEHTVTIESGPTLVPSEIDSEGSTQCSASAIDSYDDGISYHWSDNNAGGSFSPSADVRQPIYTAPANDTGADITITLTCTATCTDDDQYSDTGSVDLLVYAIDTTAPQVISVTPADGTSCVGLSAGIVIKFSKAMDRSSAQTAVSLTPDLISPTYSWSTDSKTLTICHEDLEADTDYVATVASTALDANSNAMDTDYIWAFTTTSGAWFNSSEMIVEINTEFVTPSLVLNTSEATTFTAVIGVPEGIGIDTTTSGGSLTCVEAGGNVSSLVSQWDETTREISVTATVDGAITNAEVIKGITLTAPSNPRSAQITIDGCAALDITFASPLPGDFNGDREVNITDAADFITEWIYWHSATIPVWDDAIDSIYDLAPYTFGGSWPDWTCQGDDVIDILDASAFIDCWIASHSSSSSSSYSAKYVRIDRCSASAHSVSGSSDIAVIVEDAPTGVFEVEVELPTGIRFYSGLDDCGNLKNVIRSSGAGGMLFSEYDKKARTVRIAGSVIGSPPYSVAVIHMGR